MVSREEVRFGVVPGLASLADKLSAAFAHSRNREFDFEIAKLNQSGKTRTAAAAALTEKQKAEAAAEKERRSNLNDTVSQADRLAKRSRDFYPLVPTSNDPTSDELLKNPGLLDADPTKLQEAQSTLGNQRYFKKFFERSIKNDNVLGFTSAQQASQIPGLKPSDYDLKFDDDAPFRTNLNYSSKTNQETHTAETKAVGTTLADADLSHLTPEEQASIQAKSKEALGFAAPDSFQPQDLQGQVVRLAQLGAARQTMAIPLIDYFKSVLGRDMSAEEKNLVQDAVFVSDTAIHEKYSDPLDAEEAAEDEANSVMASALFREELAEKMKKGSSIFQAMDEHAPGKNLGETARKTHYQKLGIEVEKPPVVKQLNTDAAAVGGSTFYTKRQKDAYPAMKAVFKTALPDAFFLNLIQSANIEDARSLLLAVKNGGVQGRLASETLQTITEAEMKNALKVYQTFSLGHGDGTFKNRYEQQKALLGALGYVDAAEAERRQAETDKQDAQLAEDVASQRRAKAFEQFQELYTRGGTPIQNTDKVTR
jgi:hypothetical protein